MSKGILGRKVGMTQIYDSESGVVTPVTVVEAGPCTVLQVRSEEKDGYSAVQLGFGDKSRPADGRGRSRSSQARRSERGHVASIGSNRAKKLAAGGIEVAAKAGCEPKRFVRELRGDAGDVEVGQEIKADVLDGIVSVDVTGTSKGRGYAGVMKRHNFAGQRATHGVKKCHRYPGSTGMSAAPSRVVKGKKMAGRYGGGKVTVRNLKLVRVDVENNLLLIEGAVPGPNGSMLVIKETNKLGS